ncbi:competence protein TfoX [Erwinia sp. OLTSP20]|uniref:TfoX/Sxy family DNA transformation protein n=1 Tax=unclassified Erwinia TaxID=2622719 RepID=UPI000C1975D9|nr:MULTISPECIES: TfoX/Sxy family DNA transformation protein [unclassified Erwinia]PIJ51355.1 competence protein TfoX [Erwinia sp. OAMSP11]PIJ74139.1 competence protein TfoX [Erwinia sp. OLSSP12]PIJ81571.1 competence protein TfoX [Erwinia sp. OLCASP19]PIJ86102.1 competence protein TfoX [Erwinia sp. OLMTSP26]PIJ87850.1 competence protein TfoX [Erwinia sp. OLMDSP33]
MMTTKGRIERITRVLDPLGTISVRTQFGGYSLSVGKAVFAVVAKGELYLRACEASRPYLCERKLHTLQFMKRGVPVSLDYYQVNETLWQEPEQLLAISRLCLKGAQQHIEESRQARQIRDLPNIGQQLERLLRAAGISSIGALREEGAKASWLKLRALNAHLGLNTLFALEGALSGLHYQALPEDVKADLRRWYEAKIAELERQRCR